jgi:hypothetical protein
MQDHFQLCFGKHPLLVAATEALHTVLKLVLVHHPSSMRVVHPDHLQEHITHAGTVHNRDLKPP